MNKHDADGMKLLLRSGIKAGAMKRNKGAKILRAYGAKQHNANG